MSKKSTTIDATAKSAIIICTTKRAETDAVGIECSWTIQFNSWTEEEVLSLAARSITIDAQRLFRKLAIGPIANITKATFDTARRKPRQSKPEDAIAVLEGMTSEERIEWLTKNGFI